ncbi:MAG: hypothetical protein APF81_02095 [Desulfosporosinus sp. BRH_c37]|nr:MAG: hypothetical protein APF81_02095 [Desulfosporosinus sp. BRH_c37]
MQVDKTKRIFNSQLGTGFAALIFCAILSLLIWPIWSMVMKTVFIGIAGEGLNAAGPKLAAQLLGAMVEGSCFWMIVISWIVLTLGNGLYGKYKFTERQPWAGLWYTIFGWFFGMVAFFVLINFLGIWWKPFNLAIMFTPKTAEDVQLAFEGWEAANFYVLACIIVQAPLATLFHKWPFAGNAKAPTDGFGTMALGTLVTWIVWMALIVPSFFKLSIGEHLVVLQPFGSWPAFVAFCQAFIIFFIIPAEGGELYPMKLFAKKQPLMGIIGLIIALAAAFIVPPVLKSIVGPLNLVPGMPPDVVVASLELSVVVMIFAWHHLFDDFPSAQLVSNTAARVLLRAAIWFGGGAIYGVLWLKTFMKLPVGSNNMGMGFPTMGILAGQFVLLATVLFLNCYFDKWPFVRKQSVTSQQVVAKEVAR